jgi:threonine/homoserine/homoserine lactone efflux protein
MLHWAILTLVIVGVFFLLFLAVKTWTAAAFTSGAGVMENVVSLRGP